MSTHSWCRKYVVWLCLVGTISSHAFGQTGAGPDQRSVSPPRIVRFHGALRDEAGEPRTGTVGILFSIYADATGGTALWQETQNVQLDAQGHYSVLLGSSSSAGMPVELFSSGEPRWLGVQVLLAGEKERPRTAIVSVPYALAAVDAQTLGGLPPTAFAKVNSNSPSTSSGTTAATSVGQNSLTTPLSDSANGATSGTIANEIAKFSGTGSLVGSQLVDSGGQVKLRNLESFAYADRFNGADLGARINAAINSLGSQGGTVVIPAGTYNDVRTTVYVRSPRISIIGAGSAAVQINYTGLGDFIRVQMVPFVLTQAGKIAGFTVNGTQRGISGIHMGDTIGAELDDLVVNGFSGPSGAGIWFDNVIKFTERIQVTRVHAGYNKKGVRFTNSNGNSYNLSFGYERILDLRINVGVNQIGIAVDGGNIFHSVLNATINLDSTTSGIAVAIWGLTCTGCHGSAVEDNLYTLTAECTKCTGLGTFLSMKPTTSFTGSGVVQAFSMQNDIDPTATAYLYIPFIGGPPSGQFATLPSYLRGVPLGTNPNIPGAWLNPNFGPANDFLSGIGNNFFWNGFSWQLPGDGVNNGGSAILGSNGTTDIGFYVIPSTGGGTQTVSSSALPKYRVADLSSRGLTMQGDLSITGTFSKGSGSFKIDHPLDPANKYLSHSFVESPDMMNIYNGNIVTNQHGLATVVLPDYFEALNRDFRYQLTVVGKFAQAIIIQEVRNGRFVIKTSKPSVKVSWQITGIRHDAFAQAHPIRVEEEKNGSERGHYLHPEVFGVSSHQAGISHPASSTPAANGNGSTN
jgi:trimeric autotransporter adhesin